MFELSAISKPRIWIYFVFNYLIGIRHWVSQVKYRWLYKYNVMSIRRWTTAFIGASYAEAMIEHIIRVPILLCSKHPLVYIGIEHLWLVILNVTSRGVVVLHKVYPMAMGLPYERGLVVQHIFGTFGLGVWLIIASHLVGEHYGTRCPTIRHSWPIVNVCSNVSFYCIRFSNCKGTPTELAAWWLELAASL